MTSATLSHVQSLASSSSGSSLDDSFTDTAGSIHGSVDALTMARIHTLRFHMIEARSLKDRNGKTLSNDTFLNKGKKRGAYVRVSHDFAIMETEISHGKDVANPEWDRWLEMPPSSQAKDVTIAVFVARQGKEKSSKDDLIGCLTVPLEQALAKRSLAPAWYQLTRGKSKNGCGDLHMEIEVDFTTDPENNISNDLDVEEDDLPQGSTTSLPLPVISKKTRQKSPVRHTMSDPLSHGDKPPVVTHSVSVPKIVQPPLSEDQKFSVKGSPGSVRRMPDSISGDGLKPNVSRVRSHSQGISVRELVNEEYTLVLKLGKYTDGPAFGLGSGACRAKAVVSLSNDDKPISKTPKIPYKQVTDSAIDREDRVGTVDFNNTLLQVPINPRGVRVADYVKLKLQLSHPSLLAYYMELGRCHIYLSSILDQIKEDRSSDDHVAASGVYVFPLERKKNAHATVNTNWHDTGYSKYGNLYVEVFLYYGAVDLTSTSDAENDLCDDSESDETEDDENGGVAFTAPPELETPALEMDLLADVVGAREYLFGDDNLPFQNDLLCRRKYNDIQIGKWEGTTRKITYSMRVLKYEVVATETQRLIHDADKRGCVYITETRTPQIPSGKCFYTKVQYVFARRSREVTHLSVSGECIFTSSTFLKHTIVRQMRSHLPEQMEHLRTMYDAKFKDRHRLSSESVDALPSGTGSNTAEATVGAPSSSGALESKTKSTLDDVVSYVGNSGLIIVCGVVGIVVVLLTKMFMLLYRLESHLDVLLQERDGGCSTCLETCSNV